MNDERKQQLRERLNAAKARIPEAMRQAKAKALAAKAKQPELREAAKQKKREAQNRLERTQELKQRNPSNGNGFGDFRRKA